MLLQILKLCVSLWQDLKAVMPDLWQGLQALLDMKADVENLIALDFEVRSCLIL